MKTVGFCDTGEQVSAMCLGCMVFGSRTDEATSYALLEQYLAAGGRFLDTANNYAFWVEGFQGGESERLLGEWFKVHGNRKEIFLASKVGAMPTVPGKGTETAEGLSAAVIERAIEGSLARLQTDYLDLYYAHIDHRASDLGETLEALSGLVERGLVRHIACSNMKAWRIERARNLSRAHGWARYGGVQQRYSYLRPVPGADFGVQESADDDLLDYCKENPDFTLLAYSPLLGGSYTRPDVPLPEPYRSLDADARLAVLKQVAAEVGATLNQVVLAWMMQGTPTIIPLIAASSAAQLGETLAAAEVVLSPEQVGRLTGAKA